MPTIKSVLASGLAALAIAAPTVATAVHDGGEGDVSAVVRDGRHHAPNSGTRGRDDLLVSTLQQTSRATVWTRLDSLALDFDVHHPQSMEVTRHRIYISSVEVIDRDAGLGVGHLFVLDRQGRLLRDIRIDDGPRYHPGGLDVHGDTLYVPVAEYRADSSADIYAVNLRTYKVTKLFSHDDHIGGIVYDERRKRFVGNTWGSRTFYEWNRKGRLLSSWKNPQHWIDYQDCEYVATSKTLCSGLAGGVGGLDLIDLADRHRILFQLPVSLTSPTGRLVTQNAVDLDVARTADGRALTFYTAPDDGEGTVLETYRTVIPDTR